MEFKQKLCKTYNSCKLFSFREDGRQRQRHVHAGMNERYEKAFGLIIHISNVDELHEDQIRLVKAFVSDKNIYFNVLTGYGKSRIRVFCEFKISLQLVHECREVFSN